MLAAPGIHPVPQGPVVDPQVPGHLRDRLAGRDHHLHGLSLELRAELAAMLRHETDPLSRAESHCPRSLIHLKPWQQPLSLSMQPDPARSGAALPSIFLAWGPLGDHTAYLRPNKPQVATRRARPTGCL